ncbi:winged helix-turn-helix domain-containing protein [Streptomyces sp. RS10V-4]|uniref:BTAD domain-containing putative transcriptional regulator n=1 Tax=Streptomyces rhizoryzae TaxID=2932493 RepID=UPI002003DB87|nr:BTAD domain-containing putative transcriptional regulator [Streptomyces rhizoryzae]MCK7622830.1 winged helix-turn-helix domain-containing protein [Streptomyces rhizoryzae]
MRIGMLGPFLVQAGDGVAVEVPGARVRALLAALALEPGRTVPRERLVDWVWGERSPADAANAVQALVSRLRKVLPAGVIEAGSGGYRLVIDPDAVDVSRFDRLVARARAAGEPARAPLLRAALDLWRGTAMEGIALRGSAAFDAAVAGLGERRLAALGERIDAELRLGRGAELVPELTGLVAQHPLREGFVAALMRALAEAGRGAEALTAYQRLRERLADELGADPSAELAALHTALLRGELGGRAADHRTNLRAELTSFVGRDDEVAAVAALATGHRLVTLTGAGGSGKTRLATRSARTLVGELPDGVWLVELAPVRAAGELAQATLTALGLRDQALPGGAAGGDPVDRLVAALRDRAALLVLDNCEHMIEAAAAFADRLLGACRRLRILATSREPLGITGEALWHVAPLPLPAEGAGPDEAGASPAVRLLRDRAAAVRRDTGSDARTLAAMARICRALDGVPLAIELAAARLRTMSVEQLARRLDDRFRLLTGGSRTALPRHRTLRAVVDWSWDLLTDDERGVLRRLSVFAGGASLEAAERVCADGEHVLDLLTALTEKSLLIADGEGAPRFRMLETIREYAAQRLAEAGEAERAREAHCAFFTELAETAEPHLRRAEQLDWLAVLEAEHDNIGAALRGAIADGRAQEAMRLVAAVGWYWFLSGHKAEGTELSIAAASLDGPVPDGTRAMAYTIVAMLLTAGHGDQFQAQEWIRQAHRLTLRADHRHPLRWLIGPLERMLREPDDFLPAFEPLLADDDPWVRAQARLNRGRFRLRLGHDAPDAEADIEAALTELRALGERWGISFALTTLAERLALRGEFTRACAHYEQAAAALTEVGATEDVVGLRARQAHLYWLLGDERSSARAMAEAERCADRIAWPDALAELALTQAYLAWWRGDPEQARARLALVRPRPGGAERTGIGAAAEDLYGYLAGDLQRSRAHRAEAFRAAVAIGHQPLIAQVLVGVADVALRQGEYAQAVRLLAASDRVRGTADRTQPDAPRIAGAARDRLGEAAFAEATRTGRHGDWRALAEATLSG